MPLYNFSYPGIKYLYSLTRPSLLVQTDLSDKLTIKEIDVSMIWQDIHLMFYKFIQVIPVLLLGLFIFVIFIIIGTITRSLIKKMMLNHRRYNVGLVLARLAQWVFTIAGFLVAVAIIFPSITSADLLAGLGFGSIALGFAFKDILQNYLAGILILLQQPFRIGDEIRYKNFEGSVEFIDTRATFIKSYDGRRILIPNGEIYTNAIVVNTAYNERCTPEFDSKQDYLFDF